MPLWKKLGWKFIKKWKVGALVTLLLISITSITVVLLFMIPENNQYLGYGLFNSDPVIYNFPKVVFLYPNRIFSNMDTSFNHLDNKNQPAYTPLYNHGIIIPKSSNYNTSTNTTNDFRISVPYGKIIEEINITLTNIIAPNNIITPENQNRTNKQLYLNVLLAMSFNITNSAYLDKVSIKLKTTKAISVTNLNLTVMGADVLGQPATYITSTLFPVSGLIDEWKNISINHAPLCKDSINKGVFFICVTQTELPNNKIYWSADPDNLGDYGFAYEGSDLGWFPLDVDFCLMVNISSNNNTPFNVPDPKNINLKINGEDPVSSGNGSGFYQLYEVNTIGPYAYFDASSPWVEMPYASNSPVTFDVEANYTLIDASFPIVDLGLIYLLLTSGSQPSFPTTTIIFGAIALVSISGLVVRHFYVSGEAVSLRRRRIKQLNEARERILRALENDESGKT